MDVDHAFQQLLESELKAARDLLDTLKQEFEALQLPVPDELEKVVDKKLDLLKRLNAQTEQRNAYLKKQGYPLDLQGVEQFIHERATAAQEAWEVLCDVANQLQQQNLANGGLISIGQQRAQQALAILTRSGADSETYGKGGYTEKDSSPLTSVKA